MIRTAFRARLFVLICGFLGCGGGEDSPTAGQQSDAAPTAQTVAEAKSAPETAATPTARVDSLAWVGQSDEEPFDVEQFLESRAAPEDNAAPLYLSALKQIDGLRAIGRLADSDALQAALRKSDVAKQTEVERVLQSAASALEQIDLAQAKPSCVFVTELGPDALIPHVQHARAVTRAATLQLYLANGKGDFELAVSTIKRMLRLSRDLQPRGSVMVQLVVSAIDGLVLDNIRRFTLNDPKLKVDQFDQVLALLIEHQKKSLNRQEEALRMEYIMARQTIEDLRSGKPLDSSGFIGRAVSGLGSIDYDAETTACNRIFAIMLRGSEIPVHEPSDSARRQELNTEIESLKARTKLLGLLIPVSPGGSTTRAETDLAGTLLVTAMRRFERSHGSLPGSLDEAVADTALAEIPTDTYSGKPLQLVMIGNRPTVYSVGPDRQDDGGRVDMMGRRDQKGDQLFAFDPFPGTGRAPRRDAAARSRPAPKPAAKPAAQEEATNSSSFRVWTSTVGSKLEAEFVRLVQNETVALLKQRDGKTRRVPLDKLSQQDQEWIQAASN